MNPDTLEIWAKRNWQLDPIVIDGPGEIISTGNGRPYYLGVEPEVGYRGNHALIASRYVLSMKLGRPLEHGEYLRIRGSDKKDLRLSNLELKSQAASAAELFRVNGDPILGYSHCLCECGTELDIAIQKIEPHAYAPGHKREKGIHRKLTRVRKPLKSFFIENVANVSQPLLSLPKEPPVPEGSLIQFRPLFEKLIHNLPWEEFKKLAYLMLEIETRQEKKS